MLWSVYDADWGWTGGMWCGDGLIEVLRLFALFRCCFGSFVCRGAGCVCNDSIWQFGFKFIFLVVPDSSGQDGRWVRMCVYNVPVFWCEIYHAVSVGEVMYEEQVVADVSVGHCIGFNCYHTPMWADSEQAMMAAGVLLGERRVR